MYYIEDQDPILVKNEVILEKDTLRRLNQEILAIFGGYAHRSYEGAVGPFAARSLMEDDVKYIRNYTETLQASEAVEGAKEMDENALWHYEYDEYIVPELSRLIERLLKGDSSAIDEIKKGPVFSPDCKKNEQRQWQLQTELQMVLKSAPDVMDRNRFEQLTDQIRSCYTQEYDARQQKELQVYYDRVLKCIRLKPVLTLYKDKLKEYHRICKDIREFYEGTYKI